MLISGLFFTNTQECFFGKTVLKSFLLFSFLQKKTIWMTRRKKLLHVEKSTKKIHPSWKYIFLTIHAPKASNRHQRWLVIFEFLLFSFFPKKRRNLNDKMLLDFLKSRQTNNISLFWPIHAQKNLVIAINNDLQLLNFLLFSFLSKKEENLNNKEKKCCFTYVKRRQRNNILTIHAQNILLIDVNNDLQFCSFKKTFLCFFCLSYLQ